MEKTVGKYKIEIRPDTDPCDPRDDDNLGIMAGFHSRYQLGDKDHGVNSNDYGGWDEMEVGIIKNEKAVIILPFYLYDHSGITISTSPFSCPWDSGQVGFIFISKEKIREELGIKRVTKDIIQKVTEYLEAEVKLYDQYIRGDAYGYCITDTETNKEVDSCWGYFGEEECLSEAKGVVEFVIKNSKS